MAIFRAHKMYLFTNSLEKGQANVEPESMANLLALCKAAERRFLELLE